jgi:hypothetical protein
MNSERPLRLFVDPFAAWRELAFKTAEMIAASAHAGAASASPIRVAVIDERERPLRAAVSDTAVPEPARAAKPAAGKKHKKKKRAKHR